MNLQTGNYSKTLGIRWNVNQDSFVFRIELPRKPLTRRSALSQTLTIFDPLGWIQPFIIPAKQLNRELIEAGYGWDDNVTGPLKDRWVSWLESLPLLGDLKFERCYKPSHFTPVKIELHTFCDASSLAYGCVSFLKFFGRSGEIHCVFVRGMARLAPKQPITIPRLELTSAVAAAELSRSIVSELEYDLHDVFFYTDSTSVIQFINNRAERFKTFVANRVNTIRLLSKPSQWFHISSNENPADVASRGLLPSKLNKAKLWFEGPHFLHQHDHPHRNPKIGTPNDSLFLTEVKVNFMESSTGENPNPIGYLLRYFSSFSQLSRAIAWLSRFGMYMAWRCGKRDQPPQNGELTVSELNIAANDAVSLGQADALANEMHYFRDQVSCGPPLIRNRRKLKSPFASALLKCNPFLDKFILRVGSRIFNSNVLDVSQSPIILPPFHHVTKLIVLDYHVNSGHSGTMHVLSLIRGKYWILRGQSALAKALRECVACKYRKARPGQQWMADLPLDRVTAGNRPFHATAIDYFGPIKTKLARSEYKRYGVLFCCMSTRAVHLEIAESLETSAFLDAFFRFVARRSKPATVYSDNGTNFVGGKKALADGINNWNQHLIHSTLSQRQIEWKFSPPLAPHQNGIVERLVRSAKTILYSMTNGKNLSDFSLWSLLIGVESILNQRPLTQLSDDPRDLAAITPNSILLGTLQPSLPFDRFMKSDEYRKGWRHNQRFIDTFWQRWSREYLPTLHLRQKWQGTRQNVKVGDLVLLVDDTNSPRNYWPRGRIEDTYPDKYGVVRRLKVRTATGSLMRDVRKICPLELS